MKKYTYNAKSDEQIPLFEETIDDNGLIIQHIEYQEYTSIEKVYTYNAEGKVLTEIETCEGDELSRLEYTYNEKGQITEDSHFIGGELYDQIITEYSETGYVRTTFQDGELVDKTIKCMNGENYERKTFRNEELDEVEICTYNPDTNTYELQYFDSENNLQRTIRQIFDADKKLIQHQEYDGKSNLLREAKIEILNGLTQRILHRDYASVPPEYTENFVYDEQHNLLKKETVSPSDSLLAFHSFTYNDLNQVVEEHAISNGHFDAITARYTNSNETHLRYSYEP